jgi:hypothetical protein
MDAHDPTTDAVVRRVSFATALVVGAAVVVIPYACGRAYRRWLGRNDPFDALNDRIERFEDGMRARSEIARAFRELGRGAIAGP